MTIFKGCATAIVTPFDKNNKINFESFKKLIDFQIKNNVDALVILGTTGEASTLTEQEKIDVIKFVVSYVNHHIPIIVGAGGNNTADCIVRAKKYQKLGVDALLQVAPYYNKATQQGLIEHYTQIANSVKNLPQILYNVPSRTGVNILPETVLELSKVPNIVGLKEAGGNLAQLTKLLEILPKDFSVYSGDDENIFTTLALGGKGVISVVGNIKPFATANICKLFFDGKFEEAKKQQFELLPLIRQLFCEVNPIPIKSALNIAGFNVGSPRLPLTQLSENNFEKLKNIIIK